MSLKRNMHEVEEMRERKKQKNRESAQRARDRFKAKMRWLEDQVRHIQERHDNLVRENTYMRHMHSVQTQKLDNLLKQDTELTLAERKRRHESSSDESSNSDNDSGIRSPKSAKFSIGFLSQSSKPEADVKQEPKAALPTQSFTPTAQAYAGLINPTATYGFLPHQLPKLPFQPLLAAQAMQQAAAHQMSHHAQVPSLRLSPGGTMHMEDNEDVDIEEIDVGSPVHSNSDHGIGSSEHTGSSDLHSSDSHSEH